MSQYKNLTTGKTEIYPAAYTAVTTLDIPDSEGYNTNHQVFSILTMPFTTVTLHLCFALLKMDGNSYSKLFLMEPLGVFTSHSHLKQDPWFVAYSKSTHVGFHMALHCKTNP